MNGKMHTLGMEPREQQPAKTIDEAQDLSITYLKLSYFDISDPEDNANTITVNDPSLVLDGSQWDTFTQVPPPLGTPTVYRKNDDQNSFAYAHQWTPSGTTTKYLLVIFAALSSSMVASPIEADPIGVWMGTSSGGSMPDCLKGYTAYKPAKPQA